MWTMKRSLLLKRSSVACSLLLEHRQSKWFLRNCWMTNYTAKNCYWRFLCLIKSAVIGWDSFTRTDEESLSSQTLVHSRSQAAVFSWSPRRVHFHSRFEWDHTPRNLQTATSNLILRRAYVSWPRSIIRQRLSSLALRVDKRELRITRLRIQTNVSSKSDVKHWPSIYSEKIQRDVLIQSNFPHWKRSRDVTQQYEQLGTTHRVSHKGPTKGHKMYVTQIGDKIAEDGNFTAQQRARPGSRRGARGESRIENRCGDTMCCGGRNE